MENTINIEKKEDKEENLLSFKEKYDLNVSKDSYRPGDSYSKLSRYLVYALFATINIMVNMDSGNIPPATLEISQDLNITDRELGGFASFVSFGTFIGGIISLSIINLFSRKLLLLLANALIAVALFTFPIFFELYILYFNRVIVGIFMVSMILLFKI